MLMQATSSNPPDAPLEHSITEEAATIVLMLNRVSQNACQFREEQMGEHEDDHQGDGYHFPSTNVQQRNDLRR